jgi:hypothetical protein
VKFHADDLFMQPDDQARIDFANEGGETFICGNPPYVGSKRQLAEQKEDLARIFDGRTKSYKSLDYVAGWFMKAADYGTYSKAASAFVSTNSVCQGQQVAILWPLIFGVGSEISFAHTSFKWSNLATHNAGVTVVIVSIAKELERNDRRIYSISENGETIIKLVHNINPYLVPGPNILVEPKSKPISEIPEMSRGNSPTDGGHLLLDPDELGSLGLTAEQQHSFVRPFFGADEVISGRGRSCIWIDDDSLQNASSIGSIKSRIERVRVFRLESTKAATRNAANWPHRFDERKPLPKARILVVPIRSSENRPYLPVGFLEAGTVIANTAFGVTDGPLWAFSIIASRLHLSWIGTVCARLEMRFSYTNTVGWNTFPVPKLTEKNRDDLTVAAEGILLAREAHFPATIADLYDPETMPANLRAAHDQNDEVLERIYIGRRFRNDTERLEKLFEMYTKMTTKVVL